MIRKRESIRGLHNCCKHWERKSQEATLRKSGTTGSTGEPPSVIPAPYSTTVGVVLRSPPPKEFTTNFLRYPHAESISSAYSHSRCFLEAPRKYPWWSGWSAQSCCLWLRRASSKVLVAWCHQWFGPAGSPESKVIKEN